MAIILITLLVVALSVALLAVKIIFVKNGRFPSIHIESNAAMRKQGIGCVKSMDRETRRRKALVDMIEND